MLSIFVKVTTPSKLNNFSNFFYFILLLYILLLSSELQQIKILAYLSYILNIGILPRYFPKKMPARPLLRWNSIAYSRALRKIFQRIYLWNIKTFADVLFGYFSKDPGGSSNESRPRAIDAERSGRATLGKGGGGGHDLRRDRDDQVRPTGSCVIRPWAIASQR